MVGRLPGGGDGGSDEALIRAVYEQHGQAVLAYTTRLTGDRAAAEDVLQETLLRPHFGSSADQDNLRI